MSQPIAPEVQELPDVVGAGFTAWAAHLHDAPLLTVMHVAEDVEGLPTSPLVKQMRATVNAELAERQVTA